MTNVILKLSILAVLASTIVSASSYRVRGVGSVSQLSNMHPTKKILMARESAIIDAQRRLVEQVRGVYIKSQATRVNTALLNERVQVKVEGLIKQARIVSEKQISDQAYEVIMEIVDKKSDYKINLGFTTSNKVAPSKWTKSPSFTQSNLYKPSYKYTVNPNPAPRPVLLKKPQVSKIKVSKKIKKIVIEAPPTWLFNKKDLERLKNKQGTKDLKQKRRIQDLERLNSIQVKTIQSIKRQNIMKDKMNKN